MYILSLVFRPVGIYPSTYARTFCPPRILHTPPSLSCSAPVNPFPNLILPLLIYPLNLYNLS